MKGALLEGAITIAIVLASTVIVLSVISPSLDEGRSLQRFNEAVQQMEHINTIINSVIAEAPGSRRSQQVTFIGAKLTVSGKEDKIKAELPNLELLEPGTSTQQGSVTIQSGPWISATEKDIDGDSGTDLVLENDAVIFAIKKIGTPQSLGTVNTTGMISLISNKRVGVNATPTSGILINFDESNAVGSGYTELTQIGDHLSSSGIRIVMNQTNGGLSYEALFTLTAGSDFVTLEVKRIV